MFVNTSDNRFNWPNNFNMHFPQKRCQFVLTISISIRYQFLHFLRRFEQELMQNFQIYYQVQ